VWNKPIIEQCPECKAPFLVEKFTKRHGRQLICNTEGCSYVRSEELEPVG
jgi:DNA topoisomerase I